MSPVTHQPAKRSFIYPSFGQDNKAFGFRRSQDGLKYPAKGFFDPGGESVTAVYGISEHRFQPSKPFLQRKEYEYGAVVVLPVCPMNNSENQPERVDRQVSLAASDLLSGVVAPILTALCGSDCLPVDNRYAWTRLLADSRPNAIAKSVVNALLHTVSPPSPEDRVYRTPLGKSLGSCRH